MAPILVGEIRILEMAIAFAYYTVLAQPVGYSLRILAARDPIARVSVEMIRMLFG